MTFRLLPRLPRISGAHKLVAVGAFAALVTAAGCSSGSATPASTSSTAGGASSTAGAATVTVASKSSVGAVLSNAQGMTLYHRTTDTPGTSTCTGGCASIWPPWFFRPGSPPRWPGKG